MTRRSRTTGPRRGFTLIELIVVMMVLALLVTIGFPALQNQIRRSKMMGIAQEATNGLRLARYQAIKNSRPTVYSIDPTTRQILSWVDDNDDGIQDLGEEVLMRTTLRAGLYVLDPPGSMGGPIDGFNGTNMARFNADGSVDAIGGYRFADDSVAVDARNFLEVGVRPRSVARVEIRKWDGTGWWGQDEGPNPWVWY
ncbi:MAG: GspH/FimT family pseudopilin [Thermoanaerobaculia bacterium]